MSEGNRERQIVLGAWLVVVGTAILLTPLLTLDEIPSGAFAWIGGGSLLVGSWLWSPVGIGGLFGRIADSWREARDSNGSD